MFNAGLQRRILGQSLIVVLSPVDTRLYSDYPQDTIHHAMRIGSSHGALSLTVLTSDLKALNLLLVDDNELIRAGFNHVLCRLECTVVGQTASLEAAAEVLAKTSIDIVLLKHCMPEGKTSDFVYHLRAEYPKTKVLVLLEQEEEFWEAIKSEADGYEVRHMPTYQIAAALRSMAEGYGWIGPMLSRYLLKREGLERLRTASTQSSINPQAMELLSPRELEVISLLASGMNGATIAFNLGISPKTVKLHISSSIRKLQVEDRTQAIAKFLHSTA